jgi:hypothetical protein
MTVYSQCLYSGHKCCYVTEGTVDFRVWITEPRGRRNSIEVPQKSSNEYIFACMENGLSGCTHIQAGCRYAAPHFQRNQFSFFAPCNLISSLCGGHSEDAILQFHADKICRVSNGTSHVYWTSHHKKRLGGSLNILNDTLNYPFKMMAFLVYVISLLFMIWKKK